MNTNNAQNAQNPQNDDNDSSLSMFFAAIGGAVLGMLAAILVLALVNGGTLNFVQSDRLATIESKLNAVDQNVGAVASNTESLGRTIEVLEENVDFLIGQNQSRIDWDQIQQRQIDRLIGFCGEPCQ